MPGTAMLTAVSATDFQGVLEVIEGQISVTTVAGILTAAATASIGLVFMWWGVRKVIRALMSAFRKGKISL